MKGVIGGEWLRLSPYNGILPVRSESGKAFFLGTQTPNEAVAKGIEPFKNHESNNFYTAFRVLS